MADPEKVTWTGASGKTYVYWVYPIDTTFKKFPANYIYAVSGTTGWMAIYIGETEDISERTLKNHHKKDCIERNGATHIHVHESSNEEARRAEEADLIAKHDPPCND